MHDFRDRFFDTGITEEHAAAFCAGLAKGGNKPYFAVYSTFLQRCYDQLYHDIVLNRSDVTLCIDRAGFVGEDGETHNGLLDVAMLGSLKDFYTVSPSNYSELRYWLKRLNQMSGPKAIRYPRGSESDEVSVYECTGQDFDVISKGSDTVVVTYGREFSEVFNACKSFNADIIKLNVILPLPEEAVTAACSYKRILFVEEGVRSGGLSESFIVKLYEKKYSGIYRSIAVDEPVQKQATVKQCLKRNGLDSESIVKTLIDLSREDEP